MIIYVIGAIIC